MRLSLPSAAAAPVAAIAAVVLTSASAAASPRQQSDPDLRILPLGDSITVGFGWLGGYRLELQLLLAGSADFVGSSTVNSEFLPDPEHEGHGGWTFDQLVENQSAGTSIEGWLDAFDPDVVLVHGGTNDVQQLVGWQSAVGSLRQLVARAMQHDPEVELLVAQIIPTGKDDWNLLVESFNRGIAEMVRGFDVQGRPVYAVDMHAAVGGQFESGDGTLVHPSGPLYDEMAHAWFAALQVRPPAPEAPAPAVAVAGAQASSSGAALAVDGTGQQAFALVGDLAGAEAPGAPQAWVSQPFASGGPAGQPVVVGAAGSVWFELDLGHPYDLEWLHFWNGRVVDAGGALASVDSVARYEAYSSADGAVWQPRGPIDLRPVPAVAWSPGERVAVDWEAVRYVRLEVVSLHEAAVAGGGPYEAAQSEVAVGGAPAGLVASTDQLSLSQGGSVALTLFAGPAHAGDVHLVLGSVTGVGPALPIDGVALPLVPDAYTLHTLKGAPGGPLAGGIGLLGPQGGASASFALPAGFDPSLAGLVVHHAYLALSLSTFSFEFASPAVSVRLVP